jgi:hypothetical protein
MFKKQKDNYLSDIDKFLTSFDEKNDFESPSKKKEVAKSDGIKNLRD